MTSYAEDLAALSIPIYRYSLAMDQKRWEVMDEVFTEDVTAAMGDHIEMVGRTTLVDSIAAAIDCCSATHHMNSNILAEVDGDMAEVTWRVRAWHQSKDAADCILEVVGYYDASFIRTPDGWRACRWAEQTVPVGPEPPDFFAGAAEAWAAIDARMTGAS